MSPKPRRANLILIPIACEVLLTFGLTVFAVAEKVVQRLRFSRCQILKRKPTPTSVLQCGLVNPIVETSCKRCGTALQRDV